ncbi:MAG: RsmE family RNA methyltransferase [Gemmataceae bacterium]
MADRFHVTCELSPGLLTLRGPEAHHLHVSRVRVGQTVTLFRGDGQEHPATVVEISRRDVTLDVAAGLPVSREEAHRRVACVALPKGDRAQFLVEKLTELGVAELILLQTARTVVHPGEAKLEKLQRYVIEASKQCGRNVLMNVRGPLRWEQMLNESSLPVARYIAHPGGPTHPLTGSYAFAVGPEGGFTEAEIHAAQAAGWLPLGLGPRLLRIETAALVLAAPRT